MTHETAPPGTRGARGAFYEASRYCVAMSRWAIVSLVASIILGTLAVLAVLLALVFLAFAPIGSIVALVAAAVLAVMAWSSMNSYRLLMSER